MMGSAIEHPWSEIIVLTIKPLLACSGREEVTVINSVWL
ncbi:hypothetical protein SAMN05216522_102351 [Rosenbergiella nectarea]|uniref:Uncharacterized protein n=1 Tax=Rosenbergiella nectarea TaxID=988801 RepID=A0A1H9FKA2_9GAMM|nr:hypothetical protein SAMN05216522_102351 [Rosenbergiella nectarea]